MRLPKNGTRMTSRYVPIQHAKTTLRYSISKNRQCECFEAWNFDCLSNWFAHNCIIYIVSVLAGASYVTLSSSEIFWSSISDRCAAKIAANDPRSNDWTRQTKPFSLSPSTGRLFSRRSSMYPKRLNDRMCQIKHGLKERGGAMKITSFPMTIECVTRETASWTHMRNINRNIWDAATTLPMKNPTAKLLWNFLMITVPPAHSISKNIADQRLTNASVPPRDDMVYKAMKTWMMDINRIKYLM